MDEYTDAEKSYNYRMLTNAIEHHTHNKRITEDWMEDHKKFIMQIRNTYENMAFANVEIKDRRFRAIAQDTELILSHLAYEIQTERTFTVSVYFNLCRNLKRMYEIATEVDDLSDLMNTSLNF
jgi:hypothetical protein